MYIVDKNFSLKSIDLSTVDKCFLDKSYEYLQKYPFKWNYFVNKIISNPKIVYYRDTTVILNINLIEFKKIEFVFEILKLYLHNGIIRKIIYKKEFLIIHFNEQFHMFLFVNKYFIKCINFYYYLKKNFMNKLQIYFGGILAKDDLKKMIQVIVKRNDNIYLFDASNNLNYQLPNKIIKIYLYENINKNVEADLNVKKLKLSYSFNNFKEQLYNVFNMEDKF